MSEQQHQSEEKIEEAIKQPEIPAQASSSSSDEDKPLLTAAAKKLLDAKEEIAKETAEIDKLSDEQVDETFGKVLVKKQPYNLYYADHKKKWSQRANDFGYTLLLQLLRKGVQAMKYYASTLEKNNQNVEEEIQNGYNLYSRKPSKNVIGETWSREEYHLPGLQYQYVRFKSMQRFTESYSLLQRAYDHGMLDSIANMKLVRFVSFGGGPGFELYAVRVFLNKHFPHVQVELTSQDLEEQWEHAAHILDCKFVHGTFYDEKLVDELAQNHDFGIASYVTYHYLKDRPEILERIVLKSPIKAVFCNERFEKMELYDTLSKNGVKTIPLIDQSKGRDDRLMVLVKPDHEPFTPHASKLETAFVNVPYEEHKEKRGGQKSYNKKREYNSSGGHYNRDYKSQHHHHHGSSSSSYENNNSRKRQYDGERERDYKRDSSSHHHRRY